MTIVKIECRIKVDSNRREIITIKDIIYSYESEIEEKMVEQSLNQFGLLDEDVLFPYLIRRYWLVHSKGQKVERLRIDTFTIDFMKYWLKELVLDIDNLTYKGYTISKDRDCIILLKNIYDNVYYQYEKRQHLNSRLIHRVEEIKRAHQEMKELLSDSKTKERKGKQTPIYPTLVLQRCLQALNERYYATISPPAEIYGFHYEEESLKLPLEIIHEREIHAYFEGETHGLGIKEDMLERYLVKNNELLGVEPNMIETQVELPKGRMDILIREKSGRVTIVEVKVEKDTDIIWQKWYYTNEMKKRYNTDNVRFVAIMPAFYEEIVEPLLADETPTEIYKYTLSTQRREINSMKLTPYQHNETE